MVSNKYHTVRSTLNYAGDCLHVYCVCEVLTEEHTFKRRLPT